MKNRILYFFLPMLLVLSLVSNSCKKESQKQLIQSLLTQGSWQLASVMVYNYLGNSVLSIDTLNTNCSFTQIFQFNNDNTCTYTNFACLSQPVAKGAWSLTSDQL